MAETPVTIDVGSISWPDNLKPQPSSLENYKPGEKTRSLGGVEIFSTAGWSVQAHSGVGMRPHRCLA
jgi:hypothetical protein